MKKTGSAEKMGSGIWTAVLAVIFLLALGGMLLVNRGGGQAAAAQIYQGGVLIERIDLSAVTEPYSFTITFAKGMNTISVRKGGISVSDADCSDHTCVRQGWLESGVTPIVCLPHELVIQLERDGEPASDEAFDAVTG